MRFVIREQEYERLLAAGRLRHLSGALESWRLTEAVDKYTVLRVDLDGRDTGDAGSTLFHLLLNPDGRLERAKIRVLSPQEDLSVDVLVESDSLSVSRAGADGVKHDLVDRSPGFGMMLPGLVGLALFVHHAASRREHTTIALDTARRFAPRQVSVTINAFDEERLAVTGQDLAVRPYLISRNGTRLKIWLDKYGLPVRVEDEKGLQALEDRYVRHH